MRTIGTARSLLGTTVAVVLAVGALVAPAAPAAAACPAPGGATVPAAPAPAGDLVVRGGGWGHSLGMSQYGAQGAARLGCNHEQVLTTYYAGTRVTTQVLGRAVLVTLLTNGTDAAVTAQGGPLRWFAVDAGVLATQPTGSTWSVVRTTDGQELRDGSRVVLRIARGGELRALEQGTVARVRTVRSGATVTDLRMRWDYTRFVSTTSGLQAWQIIQDDANGRGTQKYLWGLAEVPASWPQEALRAQAVAGRTYLARRYDGAAGAYVIGTTTATQHWTGYAHEQADAAAGGQWRRAVDATVDRVVVRAATGGLVDTLYSSSHGGRSEDSRYVFGGDDPVLRPVDDSRWDLASDNPYRSWAVGFTRARLAQLLDMDSVTAVTVPPRGSAARLEGATVTGVRDGATVVDEYTGFALRGRLGLRSPGISSVAWVVPAGAVPLVGDWDADGDVDPGWFHAGDWTMRHGDGSVVRLRFGTRGDVPVVGDWNGDGVPGIGVFRAGDWHLRETPTAGPAERSLRYGRAGDLPVAGHWPGSAVPGIGVVRDRTWYLRAGVATGASTALVYGAAGDVPVVGDWDRDGRATPGVVRGSTWYLVDALVGGRATRQTTFGSATDRPVAGDFDGDGDATTGIVRGTAFHWRNDLAGGPGTGSAELVP